VRGLVVWVTGKPSSGKSTFAEKLCDTLERESIPCAVLDGDEVRRALVPAPGYDAQSRDDFYATLANLAALVARRGAVVVVAATAHARSFRERARRVAPAFLEVWVDVADAEVAARDAKGLYAAVREGRASGVPGADLEYEAPSSPEAVVRGGFDEEGVRRVSALIRARRPVE